MSNVPVLSCNFRVGHIRKPKLHFSQTHVSDSIAVAENFANAGNGDGPADDLIGTVFVGRYELHSVLGTGGMGVIYRGQQVFLDRPVAVKLLKSQDISPKARTRFHQEAKAASALNHPGIVSIIDFGVDDLDRPYMVMEFVEGCTLSELLSERLVLTLEDCLPVFLECCDALGAAHKKGIVHRDIKPSNIMLVVSDAGDVHIKLLDFGIAKLVDYSEHTVQELTKTGDTLGTPLYMSPEQIDSKTVTFQSDLYSLGCTMYACLTGAPPFVGQTHIETMEMHAKEEPMSLKEASEGLDFPPELEAIIERLLQKTPARRFGSAAEVKDALMAMAAAVKSRELREQSNVRTSLQHWNAHAGGMSSSITNSVHNSLAGRAALAPSRMKRSVDEPDVEASDASLYWNSDLNDRIEKAKKTGVSRSPELASSRDHAQSNTIRNAVIAVALICGFGAVSFILMSGRFDSHASVPQAKPILNVSSTPAKPASTASDGGDSIPKAPAPENEFSTADTVIEKIIREEPRRRSLSFSDMYGLTDKGLARLVELKELRLLNLPSIELTDNSIKIVSRLNLTNLVLDGNGEMTDWGLLNLASIDHLKKLSLCGMKISDRGLSHLARAKSLTDLHLDGNRQISEAGIKNLSPSTSKIQSLSLTKCDVGDAVAEDLIRFPDLTTVAISANPRISDRFIELLATHPEKWKCLLLSDCSITGSELKRVKTFSRLQTLDLSGIPLDNAAVAILSGMKQIRTLGIANCELSAAQQSALKKALPQAKLMDERLKLPSCLE